MSDFKKNHSAPHPVTKVSSRLTGFYKLSRGERLDALKAFTDLPVDQLRLLGHDGALPFELADLFVENALGSFPLPLGLATNFFVNGSDYVVPMAVEESSVIAAASNAAKWVYESGGFQAHALNNQMIGQIQLLDIAVADFEKVKKIISENKIKLLQIANETHPRLLMRGGGARDLELRLFPEAKIPFMVLHIYMDTKDAMGANLVNTVCERLSVEVAALTSARIGLRILSNLADRKLFFARARVQTHFLALKEKSNEISGEDVAKRIVEAFVFADNDPYRATTHNKGVMNGVDPVVIATGNDWRAVSSGAHAYASHTSGRYRSLTEWKIDSQTGDLIGEITIPLQLGTVGGVTRLHPMAQLSLQILGNPSSEELGCVMACTGLASNLAALRALVTTGIQRGHMKLHAKNLALSAGARGAEIEWVALRMVRDSKVTASHAEAVLSQLRHHPEINHELSDN